MRLLKNVKKKKQYLGEIITWGSLAALEDLGVLGVHFCFKFMKFSLFKVTKLNTDQCCPALVNVLKVASDVTVVMPHIRQVFFIVHKRPEIKASKNNCNSTCVSVMFTKQGSHRLLITGFKVFSRIFKVNNNNSQGYILRHCLLYSLFINSLQQC